MLTEQTRDFEAGRHDRVHADAAPLRRAAPAALMVVAVPVLWIVMPFLIGLFYGPDFRAHATDAARLVLVAAALRLVWGWTKSFPVSIGRPGLRVIVQSRRDRRLRAAAARVRRRAGARRARPGRCSSRPSSSAPRGRSCCCGFAPAWRSAEAVRALRGPRRLGDLAAGRRRPRVARAGGRGLPARARTRGRGGDHRRRRARAGGLPGALGAARRCRRASATPRRCGCSSRSRGERTSSTRPGCSAAPRSARCSGGRRSSRSSRPTPPTSARAAGGSTAGSLEEFQRAAQRCSTLPLRGARATSTCAAPRTSSRPSAYLRELAIGWGVRAERVTLLPNPAPPLPELAPARRAARTRFGFDGPTLVFAGRLTAQKSLDLGHRGGAPRGRRARDRRRRPRPRRARAARLRALPRAAAAAGGARALPRRRRVAALLGVGELPAHGRRGARGRHAGDRDPYRRRRRGAARRRERARRRAGRRRRARRRRSSASSPTRSWPRGCGQRAAPSVADYAPDRVYGRLERILVGAAG